MQAAVDAVALITRRGQAAHSKAYGMQDREWVILPRRVQTTQPTVRARRRENLRTAPQEAQLQEVSLTYPPQWSELG